VGHSEGEKSRYQVGGLGERCKLPSAPTCPRNRRNFKHFMP